VSLVLLAFYPVAAKAQLQKPSSKRFPEALRMLPPYPQSMGFKMLQKIELGSIRIESLNRGSVAGRHRHARADCEVPGQVLSCDKERQ
jgi:hypothetical protein